MSPCIPPDHGLCPFLLAICGATLCVSFIIWQLTMLRKFKELLTKDNIAMAISVVALGMSIFFSIRQCQLQEVLYHLHIEPAISFYLDKTKPQLLIRNEGPTEVVSLSASALTIVYSKLSRELRFSGVGPDESYATEPIYSSLKPGSAIKKSCMRLPVNKADDLIEILVFDVSYYRKTDMKKYTREVLFFVEKGMIYSHKEFRRHEHYDDIRMKIDPFIRAKYQLFFQNFPDAYKKAEDGKSGIKP